MKIDKGLNQLENNFYIDTVLPYINFLVTLTYYTIFHAVKKQQVSLISYTVKKQ